MFLRLFGKQTAAPIIYRAVSSPKCNELTIVLIEVERVRREHLDGAEPVEGFARAGIEPPGDFVDGDDPLPRQ